MLNKFILFLLLLDYMPMNIVPPPLPARNAEQPGSSALSSSLPSGAALPRLPPSGHAVAAHHHHAYQHHLHHHHPHQTQQQQLYRPGGAGGGLLQQQAVTSPTDTATSSLSSEYHVMTGGLSSPVLPLATPLSSPDSNYLPMDLGFQVGVRQDFMARFTVWSLRDNLKRYFTLFF